MNVLTIAYYFPPMGLSGVQRISKFVKYLPDYGWNPIVLTTNKAPYYAFDDSLLNELLERNIQIYRTDEDITKILKKGDNQKLNYPNKFLKKIQSMLLQTFILPDSRRFWMKHAIKKAKTIFEENQIDLIFATAPPFTNFLIASELSDKYDVPFVIDYRDLWVDNPYYFYPTFFHKNYAISLESEVLKKCSRAIVISRDMKNALLSRYRFLEHNDISIIPHGFDQVDFDNIQKNNTINDKLIITHAGVFSADLTPKYFIKAVNLLFNEKPQLAKKIEFRFYGVLQKQYLKMIKKIKYSDSFVHYDYLEHKELMSHLANSDVLWLMFPRPIVTPSRFYEYLGARKPLLVSSLDGDVTRIAESTGAAIITKPKDSKAIALAILEFYNKWKNNNLPQPKESIIEKYDRKYLTQILSKELGYSLKSS